MDVSYVLGALSRCRLKLLDPTRTLPTRAFVRPSGARSCPRPTEVAHLRVSVELVPGRSHHSPAVEASREAIDHHPVSEGIGFGVAGVLRPLVVSLAGESLYFVLPRVLCSSVHRSLVHDFCNLYISCTS